MNLIAIFLRWRAAHHDRMTRALGAAVLEYQRARRWDDLGSVWRKREHHRQKRDLLTQRASAIERRAQREDNWLHADGETCPPCTHTCNEGRACPARCRT